ncbi:hypothetical protein ACFXEZ_22075, partial [Streptomyces hygroscopicus]
SAPARAGGGSIAAFELADWITPLPEGVLLGRGQLGDGSVDFRWLRERGDATGYTGPIEPGCPCRSVSGP